MTCRHGTVDPSPNVIPALGAFPSVTSPGGAPTVFGVNNAQPLVRIQGKRGVIQIRVKERDRRRELIGSERR